MVIVLFPCRNLSFSSGGNGCLVYYSSRSAFALDGTVFSISTITGGGGSMLDIIIIGVDNLVHVISSVDNFDQLPVEVFRY